MPSRTRSWTERRVVVLISVGVMSVSAGSTHKIRYTTRDYGATVRIRLYPPEGIHVELHPNNQIGEVYMG